MIMQNKVGETINGIVFELEATPTSTFSYRKIDTTTKDTNTTVKALPDNSENISGIKADTESIKNETGEVKNIVSNIEGEVGGSGTFETGEFSIVIGKGVAYNKRRGIWLCQRLFWFNIWKL